MDLKGKTIIVTGGGSGLGEATARRFAAAGAKLVIADLNKDTGNKVASDLGDQGCFVECNVTNTDQVKAAVDTAVNDMGGVHGLVNCAGIGSAMRTTSKGKPFDLDMFKFVVNVNLFGTFDFIRLAATVMAENEPNEHGERGVVINTASVAAFDGQIGQAAYSASKGAVVGMTLPIARDLSRMGIRVVTIAPGLFNTPLLAALPEEAKQSLGAQVPFPPRLGEPSEYALLAEQIVVNPMLNGETIRLDGAIRMAPK